MKKILILLTASILLYSCQKENIIETAKTVKTKTVTVDFRQIPDMNPSITFTGASGQGTFTFNISDGQLQSKQLPEEGDYKIKYSFLDCDAGCIMNAEMGTKTYAIPNSNYSVSDTLDGNYMLILICGMPTGG